MTFVLLLVVKTSVSSTYVLSAMLTTPTNTNLPHSKPYVSVTVLEIPTWRQAGVKRLTLRIPVRVYGQDGQEKTGRVIWRQAKLQGKSPSCSDQTFFLAQHILAIPRAHLWKSHSQLHLPLHEMWLSHLVFLELPNLSKISKCSLQTTPFFFFLFSLCVRKFMARQKESSAYFNLNEYLP